jgi:shikimate dehydrogenase
MVSALEEELGPIFGRRVYVAGAGGVARAIAFALAQAGAARLFIHNRSAAKADALLDAVRKAFPKTATARGDDRPVDCDIAINATSLGLRADDPLPFAVDALPVTAAVADVVMQPLLTPLLLRAQSRGLRIVKGDAMLKFQLKAWVEFLGLSQRKNNI